MSHFHAALICLNGHLVTDSVQENPHKIQKFCSKCSERNISACEKCKNQIDGLEYDGSMYGRNKHLEEIPKYCHECSEPYPWTLIYEKLIEDRIKELTDLNPEEKKELKKKTTAINRGKAGSETYMSRVNDLLIKAGSAGKELIPILRGLSEIYSNLIGG